MRRMKSEPEEQGAFLRRMVRAFGKRVGQKDPQALAEIVQIEAELYYATRRAVQSLRDAGYSWAEIAAPLGVTRQAAQQRWSPFVLRPCASCDQAIINTFGTIDGRDYCLRCHGRLSIKTTK